MPKKKKRKTHKKKRIKRNAAALIASILLIVSALIFPILSGNLFGQKISDPGRVLFNSIEDFFTKSTIFGSTKDAMISIMVILFIAIFILYLLNGLGLIFNKYSRYASYLTIVYFIFGLYIITLLNREFSMPVFGNSLFSLNIGPGIYFVPIVGVLYLLFARHVNSVVKV